MPSHNLINVEFRIILGSVSRLHRDKVGRLSHHVRNNPYGVMLSPSLRKTNQEVYINVLPHPRRNLDHLSMTTRLKMFCLNLYTTRKFGHLFCNVLLHAIPSIDLLKIVIHLGGTSMYVISGTMGLYNDVSLQIIHIWYTQSVLVPKYAIIS
ncbi:hypothetical protein EJD97_024564 [Solanum chilense]|uniref:Uncharacterized protein n=1 Tax=Solanum chilense TaxID=4083 RepID=A0A6N2AQD6_SOLCI|nr:hypothetical protein EJD97_024564 [Solanum chilense]